MTARLEVVADAAGRSRVHTLRSSAPIGLRELLRPGDGGVAVAIVQTAACLVGGDDIRLEVRVGAGARLHLRDVSALLAHPSPGRAVGRQTLALRVEQAGSLVMLEQPLIVALGARVERTVRLELAADASAVHRDTLVLGRHDEGPGAITTHMRVTRDGRPVLDETLRTEDTAVIRSAAMLGSARCIASLAVFGHDVDAPPDALHLHTGDVLVRRLASEARFSALDRLAERYAGSPRRTEATRDARQRGSRPDRGTVATPSGWRDFPC